MIPWRPATVLALLGLLLGGSGGSPNSTTPWPSTKPFLLAYGHYTHEQIDQIAGRYSLVVLGPGYTANPGQVAQLHAANPSLPVLDYAAPDVMRPYFPDWQLANADERMFVHSADPASATATWRGDGALITWAADRRTTFQAGGYALYRGTSPDGIRTLVARGRNQTSFWDPAARPGHQYWYEIRTLDGSGAEHAFSEPIALDATAPPPALALTAASWSRDDAGSRIDFSATCMGQQPRTTLHLDLSRNHDFSDPQDTVPMTPVTGHAGTFMATAEAPVDGGLPYYVTCTDGAAVARLPATGSYVTNTNNRIHNFLKDSHYDIMNVANPAWRQHFVAATLAEVERLGYDGLLVDTVMPTIPAWESDAVPAASEYSDGAWASGMQDVLEQLRAGLGRKLLYYNGPVTGVPGFLSVADGVLDENWAHPNWQDAYPSEQQWRQAADDVMALGAAAKRTLLISGGQPADVQARMFSYASFLLANPGTAAYSYLPDYIHLTFYPETALDLGAPQTNAATVDEYRDAQTGVYKRVFANGLAVVNPSDRPATVPLDGTFYQAVIAAPAAEAAGALGWSPVQTLKLPPLSGAVLLRTPPSTTAEPSPAA
jgi:hypothetical protein